MTTSDGLFSFGTISKDRFRMSIIVDLIDALKELIQGEDTFSPEFFMDSTNLAGKECHKRIVSTIKDAARKLPGVVPSDSEKELGKNPKWRPDLRLLGSDQQCLRIIEYESLNSTDEH